MPLLARISNLLRSKALRATACATAACMATPAMATLGGTPGIRDSQPSRLLPERTAHDTTGYTVSSTPLSSGTWVREFCRADGRVFAIAWQGPHMPDMHAWLGAYYADYRAGVAVVRSERRPMEVKRPTLVAHVGGHMRAFHGRAWDPTLLPAGVDVNDIQ